MSRKATGVVAFSRTAALTTASGLALVASQPAFAQDTDETINEESAGGTPEELDDENVIIVTGFAQSLKTAQSIKERADTVVDVITAEDIGALPDRSVAETLQRVPGVNIGRFEKTSDPTRFSVEGTGVIIRGLPYVRSELNGRDIFSANGGIALSFEDVSPELVGRIEVFKNTTADMIEGQISGLVNLVTRKPLDNPGLNIAGSIEANYGDLRQEWSPTFNILASDTFDTAAGTFGLQLSYSNSALKSRTDASQLVDYCYRASDLSGGCIRAQAVNSGGFQGDVLLGPDEFPPADTVLVPQFANVRSTTLDRDRQAYSVVGQFETLDGRLLMTAEYLRSDTSFFTSEYALLGRIDDGIATNQPRPGTTYEFDANGNFVSGVLTQNVGNPYASPFGIGGIPLDALRFLRGTDSTTEDYSFDIEAEFTDRFRAKFEAQHVSSELTRDSVFGATSTWADIAIDLSGETPDIQFLQPSGPLPADVPQDYFGSGYYTYYWFALDSRERNDGNLFSLSGDFEYDISDEGFLKKARFGARWAARDRVNRNTNFSTWGNLSAPWTGRANCLPWGQNPSTFEPCTFEPGRFYTGLPGQEGAIGGGAYVDEFPNFAQVRSPFADNFQRGETSTPIEGGSAFFFGGDDFLGEYLAGTTDQQVAAINDFSGSGPFGVATYGVNNRSRTLLDGTVVQCDPFCPGEISDVTEITNAAYGRLDFGTDFGGWTMSGNIGVRYVETKVGNDSTIAFPDPAQFDAVANGGNGDGIVQPTEISVPCAAIPDGEGRPDYCDLTGDRLNQFAALYTGELISDTRDITFDHWLPSLNVRFDNGDGIVIRGAVSKGISRPDLNLFNAGGTLAFSGNVESGPLLQLQTGNRNLRPVESWNYDLSAEWYFDEVGSLTLALFMKDIEGIVQNGVGLVNYSAPDAGSQDVVIRGPANDISGTLKGLELAHQQVYDFLPGLLSGLGTQFSYTYVDASDFPNPNISGIGSPSVNSSGGPVNNGPFVAGTPLQGVSEHTINATVFYERGPFSARAAYNWRSDFLVTTRDDLFPFSPIFQEAGGQLDGSIFYAVNENIKLGVQGVNLLDEVTKLSTKVDYDGTRPISAAFRNDRRYTFIARFNF